MDLRHIDEENGRSEVEIGVDLTEFYMSVEWDILEVMHEYMISTIIFRDFNTNSAVWTNCLFYDTNSSGMI